MEKLTVTQYANTFQITSQGVYKRIKRGSLNTETINGVLYILVENDDLKSEDNDEIKAEDNKQAIGILKEQLKIKDEQILKLNQQIETLSLQLSQSLKIQSETIEEKKQNNVLMAGLQKAVGLLENQTNHPKKSFFRWFK